MTKTSKQKEKILLFNNWNRKKDIEKVLDNVISIANNTVIPICDALGMPVLKPDVLKWVDDEEAFREAFVKKCKREAAGVSGYLSKMAEEAAHDDFDSQLRFHPYPVFRGVTYLTDELANMVKITSRGGMIWDNEKLTEYTNVYLTNPDQIEAYHRLEELCSHINDFFAGTKLASDRYKLESWRNVVYVTEDCTFKVNPMQDFSKLIKKEVPPTFHNNANGTAVEGV